jgi:hypothetical protein
MSTFRFFITSKILPSLRPCRMAWAMSLMKSVMDPGVFMVMVFMDCWVVGVCVRQLRGCWKELGEIFVKQTYHMTVFITCPFCHMRVNDRVYHVPIFATCVSLSSIALSLTN